MAIIYSVELSHKKVHLLIIPLYFQSLVMKHVEMFHVGVQERTCARSVSDIGIPLFAHTSVLTMTKTTRCFSLFLAHFQSSPKHFM